jgi:hypothetical protein
LARNGWLPYSGMGGYLGAEWVATLLRNTHQEHHPGVKMQTDFTCMNRLGITIRGEPFPHQLCHSVLTYSNWEWGIVCQSESMLALRKGFQTTTARLGRVPREHWTDNSTAATHVIGQDEERIAAGKMQFNRKYLDLMEHFGVTPRTIQIGAANENGDVESGHGVLKRRVEQHLLLRGSRDFGSVEEYIAFLEGLMKRANRLRRKRLEEELAVMRVLDVRLLPEYDEDEVRVTSWSTVQVGRNTYSVPSRLRGEKVKARLYEERIELYYHGVHQLTAPRLVGEGKHKINYRHVIDSLVRKPGAFRHYKYHTDMFPTEEFRWAYDALRESCSERMADREYLWILQEAARTMESRIQKVLGQLRALKIVPRWGEVAKFAPARRPQFPVLSKLQVNLSEYDHLLERKEVAV